MVLALLEAYCPGSQLRHRTRSPSDPASEGLLLCEGMINLY